MAENLTFEIMLTNIKTGFFIGYNNSWNGKGMWLKVQRPDKNSKMDLPYIFLCNAEGNLVPWIPSQMDLFSENWGVKPYDGEDIKPISKN